MYIECDVHVKTDYFPYALYMINETYGSSHTEERGTADDRDSGQETKLAAASALDTKTQLHKEVEACPDVVCRLLPFLQHVRSTWNARIGGSRTFLFRTFETGVCIVRTLNTPCKRT